MSTRYCAEHGHIAEIGSTACALCGEYIPDQMAFEDVVEMEPVPGDPEYTQWLAAGRPKLAEPTRPTTSVET